jgi:hypothetical protein
VRYSVVNCETERVRRDSVVRDCKCAINPIVNPNPVYSHLARDNWCQKWDRIEKTNWIGLSE